MRKAILFGLLTAALATPATAATYPVSGRWGQSTGTTKGAIDCTGKRVVAFDGDQRTDSGGGVPTYRNQSVTPAGSAQYRIVDVFSTGQISDAKASYTLRLIDDDHIELRMQNGTLKLQRCK